MSVQKSITLRITNGVDHAEEFTAIDLPSFRKEAYNALVQFHHWKLKNIPLYQTVRRSAQKIENLKLNFHVLDDGHWYSVGSYPQAEGLGYKGAGYFPVVSLRNIFRCSDFLWECARQTIAQGEVFNKFVRTIEHEFE